MRGSLRASATTPLARAAALFVGIGALSCAQRPPPPPPKEPPARVLAVRLDRVRLRTSAYVELHAWLATMASGRQAPPPELERATRAYARATADDDEDTAFGRAASALGACESDRCAFGALEGTRFEEPFTAALPGFVARSWTPRARFTRAAVERVRAAMGPEAEALRARLARDLAVDWPEDGATVHVVVDAPPASRAALVPPLLGARGSCFVARKGEEARVRDARLVDCALAYAALPLAQRSALGAALARELGPELGSRAWGLVVVHAVAATVKAWEPRHASVMRRSAGAVEPRALAWLSEHWHTRAQGEEVAAFAGRFAAVLRAPEREEAR